MQKTVIKSFEYGPGIAEVDTVSGRVRGVIRNGIYTYLGIRYADAERFEAPHPPAKWEGVKEALVQGPICPSMAPQVVPETGNILNPPMFYPADEHCQTLKLWTPSIDPNAKKPVMFWLHGGGSAFGNCLDFEGEEMAAHGDVVVIASHHRLNCLALLDLEGYGPEFKDSCNLEFLDIIEALKWVKENVRAFGGDPENVTIFGHSGGGGKVLNLMQMPAADGLYHKAILMAGILPEPNLYPPKECSTRIAERTLENLGIAPENVNELRTIPYEKLAPAALAAMRESCTEMGYRATWSQPTSDFFPGHPFDVGLRPEVKDIPVFIGSVRGERNSDVRRWSKDPIFDIDRHEWTDEQKEYALRLWFGDKYDEVCRVYPQVYPERELVDAIFTDMGHRANIMRFVDMKNALGGAPCYMYLFNREMPVKGGTTPWHGVEIDFAIHHAEYSESRFIPDGETQRMQDEMCGCWTAFAHNGDPNHPGVPYLPPCTDGNYATIVWDTDTTVRINHDRPLLGLLPELELPNDPRGYAFG